MARIMVAPHATAVAETFTWATPGTWGTGDRGTLPFAGALVLERHDRNSFYKR